MTPMIPLRDAISCQADPRSLTLRGLASTTVEPRAVADAFFVPLRRAAAEPAEVDLPDAEARLIGHRRSLPQTGSRPRELDEALADLTIAMGFSLRCQRYPTDPH